MLKRHGFRKTAFNFSRRQGTVEHHFNVQLSQCNYGSTGRFFLNAGVMFDDLLRLRGQNAQELVKYYDCDFRVRLEEIDPQLPRQVDINQNTDIESVGRWLAERVEVCFVVPLSAVSSTQEFLATGWVGKGDHWDFPAVFHYVIGNKAEARRLVEVQAKTFADRGCTFESVAKRLHLSFNQEL